MITTIVKDIPAIYMPSREGDIRYSQLDNTKAASILGWQPSYDLQAGLSETFKYYKPI